MADSVNIPSIDIEVSEADCLEAWNLYCRADFDRQVAVHLTDDAAVDCFLTLMYRMYSTGFAHGAGALVADLAANGVHFGPIHFQTMTVCTPDDESEGNS